jgi:hypothetical protein
MKISREWATPVTIGAFVLMAVTGLLMFFHWDSGLNKLAHEWLGWVMIAGVALHVAVNWGAFRRYFMASATGRGVIAAFAVILLTSFAPVGGGKGAPPPVLAMNAIARAPIAALAPLAGRSAEEMIRALNAAGIAVAGPEASIASVAGNSRELQAKAMAALFGAGKPD